MVTCFTGQMVIAVVEVIVSLAKLVTNFSSNTEKHTTVFSITSTRIIFSFALSAPGYRDHIVGDHDLARLSLVQPEMSLGEWLDSNMKCV